MRLYIVQHGDAVPKDINPERPLSDRGRADIERLAEWLSGLDVQVEQILHSGKLRARETAEILQPRLQARSQIRASDGLAPNDSPEAILDQLRCSTKDTLVASHMPFVMRAVSQALTGAGNLHLLEFVPGSVAGIESLDGDSWRLFLFARPEVLNTGKVSQAVDQD